MKVSLFIPCAVDIMLPEIGVATYKLLSRLGKQPISESKDTSYLDIILPKFDSVGGVMHGLVHKTNEPNCMCPACMSRPKESSPN